MSDLPLSLLHWKDSLRDWVSRAESKDDVIGVSIRKIEELADAIELAEKGPEGGGALAIAKAPLQTWVVKRKHEPRVSFILARTAKEAEHLVTLAYGADSGTRAER